MLVMLVLMGGVVPVRAVAALTVDGVLAHTNAARYRDGAGFLVRSPELSKAAETKLNDLFARQYFAHDSPTGESIADLAKQAGYRYITVGENLALGTFGSSKAVVDAWMGSPGHRANILKRSYQEIGIAVAEGTYEGRRVWIAVQAFGLPQAACPPPSETERELVRHVEARLKVLLTVAELRKAVFESTRQSSPLYLDRYDSFKKAALLYNDELEQQKKVVAKYNRAVESFNSCVKRATSS